MQPPMSAFHHSRIEDAMSKLKGKIAVITGANSGIGLASAKRFVAEGAHVYITGRRQEELDKAVQAIGAGVTAVQGDVSDLEALDRLFSKVRSDRGRIDVLFANAGLGAWEPRPSASTREQGSDPQSCPQLGARPQGYRHPRERSVARRHGHAWLAQRLGENGPEGRHDRWPDRADSAPTNGRV